MRARKYRKKRERQAEQPAEPTDAKEEKLVVEGRIVETLPNGMFRVEIPGGHRILAYVAGKMRIHFVRLLTGDRVRVELSTFDLSRGRITYRLSEKESAT